MAERSPGPDGPDEPPREPAEIDISVAHAARVYDYLLGGSDNFAVDREAAELQAREIGGLDNARTAVRAQRAFLVRALHHLAGEAGVRQFLDLGTGIPTEGNVHQVVQAVAPGSRIVCVDNDTLVLAHAHAYMKATSAQATAYVDGDLRDVKSILTKASATLDLSKPFAVVLVAVLHLFADDEEVQAIVGQLVGAMPSGSYLVLSHLTNDFYPKEITRMADVIPETARFRFNLRTYDQVSRLFHGVELVEPGLVRVDQWRPDGTGPPSDGRIIAAIYGGVARKP